MELPVTNKDLFEQLVDGLDDLYVVAQTPKCTKDGIEIRIDLDGEVAVIDKHKERFPFQNATVSAIRTGKHGGWLLSGGAIIFDQTGRIAVGMRDGNAADPFAYTNIAAGRCDQKFIKHCYEELASEFVLCISTDNCHWQQINFGKATVSLDKIRKAQPAIAKWKKYVKSPKLKSDVSIPLVRTGLQGMSTIKVCWEERNGCRCNEKLKGFLLVDKKNYTVEFRLPVEVDLSGYKASEIFFAEGAGYATWLFPEQIHQIGRQVRNDGSCVVTPFLTWLVTQIL